MEESIARFHAIAARKYKQGQAEHGGNLWEKPNLIEEMEAEVLDQWFFIQALRQKLKNS